MTGHEGSGKGSDGGVTAGVLGQICPFPRSKGGEPFPGLSWLGSRVPETSFHDHTVARGPHPWWLQQLCRGNPSGLGHQVPASRPLQLWRKGRQLSGPHLALCGRPSWLSPSTPESRWLEGGRHTSGQTPALGIRAPWPLHSLPAPRPPLSWRPWPGLADPAGNCSASHDHVAPGGCRPGPLGHPQGWRGACRPFLDAPPIPGPVSASRKLSRLTVFGKQETPDASHSRSLVRPGTPSCLSPSWCVQPAQGMEVGPPPTRGNPDTAEAPDWGALATLCPHLCLNREACYPGVPSRACENRTCLLSSPGAFASH